MKSWVLNKGSVIFIEFALVVALAVSLAYWTWIAVAPRPVAISAAQIQPTPPQPAMIAKRHLFGVARGETVAPAGNSASGGRLVVVGVFAGSGPETGRAMLALDGAKSVLVAVGDEVAAGIVVREVHPDYVLVTRDGAPERVNLERQGARLELQQGVRPPTPK